MKSEGTESPAPASTTPTPTTAAPATQTTPTTSTPTSTPTPTYATTSWATSAQIPIDPALQQQSATQHATASPYQHYQYASHYPQAAYTHYPAYAATLQAQQAQAASAARAATSTPATVATVPTATNPTATVPTATNPTATAPGVDTSDIATLNDALGSANIDLRAEEESLQRTHDHHQTYRPYEDRTKKQPPTPNFDIRYIGPTMRTIGTQHNVTKIPDDSINYLALALRARLQDLVTAIIAASHHRTDTQFDRPASLYEDNSAMWSLVIRSDVVKQLSVLEKVEREEEIKVRRERKERIDMAAAHAALLAAQANGAAANPGVTSDGTTFDEEGNAKKKRKKEGPGVTARNMSEDVRKKMSNAVATQAAGLGGKYAWMTAANAAAAASPAPKPKPAATPAPSAPTPVASTSATTSTATPAAAVPATTPATITTPATTTQSAASSWARPYVSTRKTTQTSYSTTAEEDNRTTVTIRDAMFVVEKERGHGGGRGAARGWV